MRYACMLLITLLLGPVAAHADEEPNIEFFYPLITRRPVIEREIEFAFRQSKSREERESQVSGAIEWPLTPWWQIEMEIPFVIQDPTDLQTTAGPGDLEIQDKFQLLKSVQHRALLAGGFEIRLPSGSEKRLLGGEFAIEPFLTGGIAVGPLDVLADVAYEWNLNNVRGQNEQECTADLAVAWPVSRWFTPLLELDTVTMVQGPQDEDSPKLRARTQIYLTPGFNVHPLPGMTFRAGVQLPTSSAKTFDFRVHAGLVWEF